MTFILDMATGTECPREAAGCQHADTLKAYPPGRHQGIHTGLQLALVEAAPADQKPPIASYIDIAGLIGNIED